MTTESPESSPRKSETRSEELRTPTLDLFNVLTLAEDIAAEPAGRSVKRFAGQIVEDCERDDMEPVRELAQEIRATADQEGRARLALQIIETVTTILEERDAEAVQIEAAPISAAV
jgi:hypothetical protein